MSKLQSILNAFMPQYVDFPLLGGVKWQAIRCCNCNRVIGERSEGMRGEVRLICRRCKQVNSVIVV